MEQKQAAVVVIGAGPAGYVAAIRAAQLGKQVVVVEQESLGGVCLNVGCIPSKALIHAGKLRDKLRHISKIGIHVGDVEVRIEDMVKWKAGIVKKLTGGIGHLFKNHKIEAVMGQASFAQPGIVAVQGKKGNVQIRYEDAIIATGSRPIEIPGFAFDEKDVWSSTGALAADRIPPRLLVIGGGYIGLELGMFFRNVGSEVTVVEMTDTILPGQDPDLCGVVARSLKKHKIKVLLGSKALGYERRGDHLLVQLESGGKKKTVEVDQILSTVGRRPNSENLGLENIGLAPNKQGFLEVDDHRQTAVPRVYAIGDVAGQPMLAHKGSREGIVAAHAIAGDRAVIYDPVAVPAVIFTDPEVASVGLTEEQAKSAGYDPVVGRFPFAASGRALSLNETDGFTKVVADRSTDVVLGIHMVGPEVSELIAEGGLALEMGATVEDLASTIHAHPTLPETVMEAAEAVHSMAVHIYQPRKGAATGKTARA
jgi:dihydrolipoamide dehydrogenase